MDAIANTLLQAPPNGEIAPSAVFVAGPLRLTVFHHPVRHAVDAAIALHACDELLCALQDWTALDLDWHWHPAPSHDAGLQACAQWCVPRPAGACLEGTLELPWALLRELPSPAASLAQWLEWPILPVVLVVAQLHVPAGELALLEPGGAVLLPESFAADWHGLLRAKAVARLAVPVALQPQPRLVAGTVPPSQASAADGIPCEVRRPMAQPVRADSLAGWHAGQALSIGPLASLWRRDGDAERPLAGGRLMPWGDGQALYIERVFDACIH